jgi:hypothetical protein
MVQPELGARWVAEVESLLAPDSDGDSAKVSS